MIRFISYHDDLVSIEMEKKEEVTKEQYERFVKMRITQREASIKYYYKNRAKILEKAREKYAKEKSK